ncbi:MAG TPA: PA14 domain-containing protein [Verrucomicrobiae bacterium]|nr:PA14 domain-containing protein [Verrucomicrobiae bacterium]
MKPIRLLGISASLLLFAGAAGAQTTVFYPGTVRYQFWSSDNPNGAQNPSRQQVEAGLAGIPTTDDYGIAPTTYTAYDTKEESGDNYADRLSGYFIPDTTTNYVFFIASDDDGDCFLSTDENPLNKRLICQEVNWGNRDEWVANGGGAAGIPQKRSDQWSPDGVTVPFKNGIPLVAGKKYWLEAVHHEGGGGDAVGVTFKFVGEPDPTNNAPSRLTGNLIGYGYTIPAKLGVQNQVSNVTALAGMEATFTFVVSNTLPDPLNYQWYKNGTVLSNATYSQHTFLATPADNNAQFFCVVTLPFWYSNSISVTSSVATLTVNNTSLSYTNGLKVERFLGFARPDVEGGNTGPASDISVSVNGAEAVPNDGINNYGRRMSGWYIPPTTGKYVFFLSSDDDSDLFLSTDATASNKQLIAQESNWSPSRQWVGNTNTDTTSPGGSLLSQKRSDQWTNSVGDAPFTNGISLTAGTPYYIEADMHQGGGGDNLGVLAQLVGTPDPTNGAPPIPASQLSLLTKPVTTLTWTNQPHNQKVFEGGQPIFAAGATSDSEFAVLYQWQRSGTNIPGATGKSYSFTTTIADNGTQFDVVASTAEGGLSITSSVVSLTVQQAVFEPGLALMQYWVNQGADLTPAENGLLGTPDFTMTVPAFEAGVNNENGDNYINEVSGFFVPAVTQAYDFITTGDDHNDFFLSTDSNPNNKRLICQMVGWSNALTWGTDNGGGADLNQKHSVTYTNAAGTALWANGISLTAGTKYYMEVWHQEGGGGDSVAVTFVKHGDPDPADGTDSAMTGNLLGFNAPNTATYVAFTNQPQNQTALSGQRATFNAGGVSDGTILIGTTGQFQTGQNPGDKKFLPFPNVLFQWYRNGVLIPGAITPTYTTPPLKTNDSAQYYAAIRALGMPTWSNSVTATLTVITDTNKPTAFASVFDEGGLPVISVSFSKVMDLSTLTNQANYSVSGGGAAIVGIVVNTNDARHVQLQLAAEPTGPITLTLAGLLDFSGNAPVSNTLSVLVNKLTNVDIGDAQANPPDPAFPGSMWSDGPGAYTIRTEGSDIWGNADGFNFSYEIKTNDFDVVVQQLTFTKVSNWSKGGLMVREDLTAASRNWNIVNDPTSADGINAIDGSGTGANTVECNTRPTNSLASLGWATGPGTVPAYPNAWVRLKRTGQMLQGFWSSNGVQWVQEGSTDWSTNANGPMPANVYVGICGTAHDNNAVTATDPTYYYTASFANYNSSYIAPTNTPQASLKASISGGNISISWTPAGGTLQSSPTVGPGATWTPVGTANPASVPISGSTKFFRVGP